MGSVVFSPGKARQGINALRDGVPPPEEIAEWLTVGQAELGQLFEKSFKIVCEGGFEARLIVGVPGAGKSHLFARLRRFADERRCLICYCVQDRTTQTTLNRPDLVYRELVDQMRLPAGFGPFIDPLTAVHQHWAARALPLVSSMAPSMGRLYVLEKAGLVPSPLTRLPRRTGLALIGYLLAVEAQDHNAQETMINVLRGLKVENREVIEVAKGVGLTRAWVGWMPNAYDTSYWLGQFATICHVVRTIGLAGTVLLLDELESLVDLPRSSSRTKAYSVLHAFLFDDYQAPGLLTACAFTPTFVNGLRHDTAGAGDKFHREWSEFWKHHYSEIPAVSPPEASRLVAKISHLYGIAYSCNAERFIQRSTDSIVDEWLRRRAPIGELVRATVARLDAENT